MHGEIYKHLSTLSDGDQGRTLDVGNIGDITNGMWFFLQATYTPGDVGSEWSLLTLYMDSGLENVQGEGYLAMEGENSGSANLPRIVVYKPWYAEGLSTVQASDLGGGSLMFQTNANPSGTVTHEQPVIFWKAPYTGTVRVMGPIGHYHGEGETMDGTRFTVIKWDTQSYSDRMSMNFNTGAGGGLQRWEDEVNTNDPGTGERSIVYDSHDDDADDAMKVGEAYQINTTVEVASGDMLEFMLGAISTSDYDSVQADLNIMYMSTDREDSEGYANNISLSEAISRADNGVSVMDTNTGVDKMSRLFLETGWAVPRSPKIMITNLVHNTGGSGSPNGSITAKIVSGGDSINDTDDGNDSYKKFQLALINVDYSVSDPNDSWTSTDMGPSGGLANGESRTWNNLRGGGWKVLCRILHHSDSGEGHSGSGFGNLIVATTRVMQMADS